MKKGPLISVGAVALLAAGVFAANIVTNSDPAPAPAAATTSAVTSTAPNTAATSNAAATSPADTAVPFPATADYAGRVTRAVGAPIALSIAVKGDKATAYACDGSTVETWLSGSTTAGRLELTGRDGASLTGRNTGGKVDGTLRVGEKSWPFTAPAVTAPGGTYVYQGAGQRMSWTVDGEGQIAGVRRGADGRTSPAPVLYPGAGTAVVDGRTVTVERVEGGDDVA